MPGKNSMRKKLPAIAALLILLAGCAAYAGRAADSFLEEAAAGLHSRLPGVALTLKERRWRLFHGVRTYRLEVAAGTFGLPRPMEADVRVWTSHGPVSLFDRQFRPSLARAHASIVLTQDASPEVIAFFGAVPELLKSRLVVRLGYTGSVSASVTVPPATRSLPLKSGEALALDWGGLEADATLSPQGEALNIEASAPRLSLTLRESILECAGLTLAGNLAHGAGPLYHGRLLASADKVGLAAGNGETGAFLEAPALTLDLLPMGETFDLIAQASAVAKSATDARVSLRAGATMGNLDAESCARLAGAFFSMQGPAWRQSENLAAVAAILARSPWVAMEASVTGGNPDERAEAAASLRIEGLRELPVNALNVLPSVRATVSLAAPPSLFAHLYCARSLGTRRDPSALERCESDVVARLDALAAQGVLLREGGRLRARGQWDGSALTLNGKRF
jgi:hypothetical protein